MAGSGLVSDVVIGAASGMGAAVAEQLARGRPLVVADRDRDRLADVASHLGPATRAIPCDVTVPEEVEALAQACDRVGALVITAGLSPSMAPGRRIYEVNLIGTERVLRAFEPLVGEGSAAVCFASMAAHLAPSSPEVDRVLDDAGSPGFFDQLAALGVDVDDPQLAYPLSKRGVVRLVRRLAPAWGSRGARLLSLSPGIVDTGMGRLEAAHEPAMEQMVQASPLGRPGRADEVASAAVFLASGAASFMTGTDVLVDGGAVAVLTS